MEDLSPDGPAHLAGKVQTGIRLVDGLALRAGEIDKVAAVFQHLGPTGLLACFVRQVCRGDGCTGSDGVAADIGVDQPHSNIFRQRVQCPFGGGVGGSAEGPDAVD